MLYKIQQHPIKPQLHFQNRPTVDGIFFRQKCDYSGDNRQYISRSLGRYWPLFLSAENVCVRRAFYSYIFFSASVPDIFC